MKILKTVQVDIDGKEETIDFGIPETSAEMQKMFALRYSEYSRRGYINPEKYSDGQEKDDYDDGRSFYFIAVWKDKAIGTIRLIQDNILPTENDFQFDEPTELSGISRQNRAEFGRFVIVPPDRQNKKFLPRGLVMLVMFSVLLEYCREQNILGGYSFIKTDLYKKMCRLRMPVRIISPYLQKYPENGVLHNYFSQKENPVIPIVFLTDDFENYLRKILSFKLIFAINGKNIRMKNNFFTRLLRFLKII
jgi:N-acyl-L-homoserine lactone synthetase